MAHNQVNEVDELLKGLRNVPGFKSYLVLNNDGIVIRWDQSDDQMTYQSAVQHGNYTMTTLIFHIHFTLSPMFIYLAHHIMQLQNKGVASIQELMGPQENVENIRVRTEQYEMIISSMGSYTLAVFQEKPKNEESTWITDHDRSN